MTSYLNITSSPEGAKIFLDGVDTLLITPTTTPFILDSGYHNYMLTLSGYETVIGSINLTDNENYILDISLISTTFTLYEKVIYIGAATLIVSIIGLLLHKRQTTTSMT